MARRLRMRLEYDGTDFSGFQWQPGRRTVQGVLETALGAVCGHPVRVTGAGRTDAGVHACGQVVHFDTTGSIPTERIEQAVNGRIGSDLRVREPVEVDPGFHARFAAASRTYRFLLTARAPGPLLARCVHAEPRLAGDGAARIEAALAALPGRRDFRPYSVGEPAERNTVRTLLAARCAVGDGLLCIELTADAFLRAMARCIVGELLRIGRGERPPEAVLERWERPDAVRAEPAPACGLCLWAVAYADGYSSAPRDLEMHRPWSGSWDTVARGAAG